MVKLLWTDRQSDYTNWPLNPFSLPSTPWKPLWNLDKRPHEIWSLPVWESARHDHCRVKPWGSGLACTPNFSLFKHTEVDNCSDSLPTVFSGYTLFLRIPTVSQNIHCFSGYSLFLRIPTVSHKDTHCYEKTSSVSGLVPVLWIQTAQMRSPLAWTVPRRQHSSCWLLWRCQLASDTCQLGCIESLYTWQHTVSLSSYKPVLLRALQLVLRQHSFLS